MWAGQGCAVAQAALWVKTCERTMATKAASAATSVTFSGSVVDCATTVVRTPPSAPLNSFTVVFHMI